MTITQTDRIEKKAVIRAPRSRVWRAIANPEEFGAWFLVRLDGPFVEGAPIKGQITHPGYEHLTMELQVERIEPESYFAYRWHPYTVDPAVDYNAEPATLVEFHLEDAGQRNLAHDCRIRLRPDPPRTARRSVSKERRGLDAANAEHRALCLAAVAPMPS